MSVHPAFSSLSCSSKWVNFHISFSSEFFFRAEIKYCLNSVFEIYYKKLKLVEKIMLTVPEEEQIEGLSVSEVIERIK